MDTIILGIRRLIRYIFPYNILENKTEAELIDYFKQLKVNNQTDLDNETIDEIIAVLEGEPVPEQDKRRINEEGSVSEQNKQ